jgi:hypothetical protein
MSDDELERLRALLSAAHQPPSETALRRALRGLMARLKKRRKRAATAEIKRPPSRQDAA